MTELSENWLLLDKTNVNQRPILKLLKSEDGDLEYPFSLQIVNAHKLNSVRMEPISKL